MKTKGEFLRLKTYFLGCISRDNIFQDSSKTLELNHKKIQEKREATENVDICIFFFWTKKCEKRNHKTCLTMTRLLYFPHKLRE